MKNSSKVFIIGATILSVICASALFFLSEKESPAPSLSRPTSAPFVGMGPAPEDGKGTAVVIPDNDVFCGAPGTWTLTFTVAKTGIAVGGGVAFHVSPFWGWTPPQNYSPMMPGYVSVLGSNRDASLDVLTGGDQNYILVRTTARPLLSGDTIKVVYGDTQNGEYLFIKVDGDGDGHFFAIDKHPSINILARPAKRLIITAPSMVAVGVSFSIKAAAVDVYDNWVRSYDDYVTLTSSPAGATFKAGAVMDGAISFECTIPMHGNYRFFAEGGRGVTGISNPIICTSHQPRFRLFWADLHGHSQLSDGTGTPEEYFSYARFVSGLDAAALTDHDAHGFEALDEHEKIWSFIKDTANKFHIPGRFITFVGYEWTNWTYGHKHLLFFDHHAPLYSFRDPASNSPEKLWQSLKGYRAITISHHVGGGPIAANWDFYDPDMEPVVEVCSIHGNSEYMGCPGCIYNPQKGSFVRDALARGYRLGIIAGGDTHNGHPGMGDPMAPMGGITAIYSEDLSRDALWDALKKKRVYGTSGDRIILDFRINGHLMGETVQGKHKSVREIHINVIGTDRLELIEIIKNNQQFGIWQGAGSSFKHIALDEVSSNSDFYYLRVVQNNGQLAWSSPIWFQ
jgi:hypothetical protein